MLVEASDAIIIIRGEASLNAGLNLKEGQHVFAHGVERVGEECMVFPQLVKAQVGAIHSMGLHRGF